jgi:hypothetical protein
MTYALLFAAGIIAARVLWRPLAALLRGLGITIGVLLAGRLALLADARLAEPSWSMGALVGGVVGFVVIGLLCYALIYHAIIAADLRRAIERDKQQAQARRLF